MPIVVIPSHIITVSNQSLSRKAELPIEVMLTPSICEGIFKCSSAFPFVVKPVMVLPLREKIESQFATISLFVAGIKVGTLCAQDKI